MNDLMWCPACHCPDHDPGSCANCPRCELHVDEALIWVARVSRGDYDEFVEAIEMAAVKRAMEALIMEIGSMQTIQSWSKVETEARRGAYSDVLAVISDRLATAAADRMDEVIG